MKYVIVCLMLVGCGSLTEVPIISLDSGQTDADKVVADAGSTGGANGTGGTVGTGGDVFTGTVQDRPMPTGSGGAVAMDGTGGVQGTGGAEQGTGGSMGGNNGTGGVTVNPPCGLSLPVCPGTVETIYYDMVYSNDPSGTTNQYGPREPRICNIDMQGMSVADDTEFFHDVRCGNCLQGIAGGKRGVYNCLINAGTALSIDPTSKQPVRNDIAVFCLPINGVCPDTGVHYTKWNGPDTN